MKPALTNAIAQSSCRLPCRPHLPRDRQRTEASKRVAVVRCANGHQCIYLRPHCCCVLSDDAPVECPTTTMVSWS